MSTATLKRMIRTGDDPVLTQKCEEVKPGESLDFLLTHLKKVCDAAQGLGLAAPQIGVLKRVVYIKRYGKPGYYMINPTIEPFKLGGKNWGREGCLSYPGVEVEIRRWNEIRVAYLDEKRNPQTCVIQDDPDGLVCNQEARIIQHEVDHLDGICLVGQAIKIQRERAQMVSPPVGALSLHSHTEVGEIRKINADDVPVRKSNYAPIAAAALLASCSMPIPVSGTFPPGKKI